MRAKLYSGESSQDQQEQEYEVQFVYGKSRSIKDQHFRYAVKWDGWSMNDMSWEPIENFVNETKLCVRRFERALSYFQYYNEKKTTTKGIRVHILGNYGQVYVPAILHVKKFGNIKNGEAKPIIKTTGSKMPLTSSEFIQAKQPEKEQTKQQEFQVKEKVYDKQAQQMVQKSPSQVTQKQKENPQPDSSQNLENNSVPRSQYGGESQSVHNEPQIKLPPIQITPVSQSKQQTFPQPQPLKSQNFPKKQSEDIVQKREEGDEESSQQNSKQVGQFMGKFSIGSFGKQKENMKKTANGKVQIDTKIEIKKNDEEESQMFQRMGPTSMFSKQKVRQPSNRFKLLQNSQIYDSNGQPAPREKQKIKTERDYLNEIINAQRLKEQNQKQQVNDPLFTKINYGDGMVKLDPLNPVKVQEGDMIPPFLQAKQTVKPEDLRPFKDQQTQTEGSDFAPEEKFYVVDKKMNGYLKLKKHESLQSTKIHAILSHNMGQTEFSRNIFLIFQIKIIDQPEELYASYEYLRDNEIQRLIEYSLQNIILI